MKRNDVTKLVAILVLNTCLILVSGAKMAGYQGLQIGLVLLIVITGVTWIVSAKKEDK